jgi:dTDP-4-amino-4,6-dideoxygalactose transaminase
VLDRGVLSGANAPEARAFEREFADFVGAKHALLTHSGTSALVVALAAAGVTQGDEVLVPTYTFVATPLAVTQLGAIPLFVDVDPRTGLMDPAKTEQSVGPRTKAIMPVHVHGCPVDLKAFNSVADRHGLAIVEDAAQAHGATFDGKTVGALCQGGGFSLQSSKNLSAGEGGVFVTNSAEALDIANSVRNFGHDVAASDAQAYNPARPLDGHRAMESVRLGAMFRGNEMMAALARTQLAALPERTDACQRNAERLSRRLADLPGVLPPLVPKGRTSVHHKFRVHLDLDAAGVAQMAPLGKLREVFMQALRAEGLHVVDWERAPQPRQKLFSRRGEFPFNLADTARVEANYSASYPGAESLLASSFLLFSQSAPLIAQSAATVDAYADAFEKVWHHRRALVERSLSG